MVAFLIPVGIWAIKAAAVYATYRTVDELAFDGKVGDTVGAGGEALVLAGRDKARDWFMDDEGAPQSELSQNFGAQNGGGGDNSSSRSALESSTSNLPLAEKMRLAAENGGSAPPENEEGNGLWDMITNNMGLVGAGGGAAAAGLAAKFFGAGAGGMTMTSLLALGIGLAVAYRKEIGGFLSNSWDSVANRGGPVDRLGFENSFIPRSSDGRIQTGPAASPGSFAELSPT